MAAMARKMLQSDDDLNLEEEAAPSSSEPSRARMTITTPDLARVGAIEVVSMRALWRALNTLRRTESEKAQEFERALTKVINSNGTIARMIEDGRK